MPGTNDLVNMAGGRIGKFLAPTTPGVDEHGRPLDEAVFQRPTPREASKYGIKTDPGYDHTKVKKAHPSG